jgi:hypothetical protein
MDHFPISTVEAFLPQPHIPEKLLPETFTNFLIESTLQEKDRSFKTIFYLTPWIRVLLEKLTGRQLVNKFPAFYGPRRFITALTRTHHRSLS